MEQRELLLIGTVHGDPEGPARLSALLQRESPSVVVVEVSPYGLAHRQRNGRRLRRLLGKRLRQLSRTRGLSWRPWGQFHALFGQVRMPFEFRSSLRFCRESGAELSCADLSSESRRLIGEQWDELVSRRNLEALLAEPPENLGGSVGRIYAFASRLLIQKEKSALNPYICPLLEDADWQTRENHLALEVRRRFVRMASGRLAYIGGWQHLIHPTDAETLCDLLADLRPRRVLLGCQEGSIPIVLP